MPGVHESDRSARPSLPRQAKLPKTPPRPPHRRLTRATAPASVAASYLSSPVSPYPPTQSDDDEPLIHPKSSGRKRKAVRNHDASIEAKRPKRIPRSSTINISYAESDSDTDLIPISSVKYNSNVQYLAQNADADSPSNPSRRGQLSRARKQLNAKTSTIVTPVKEKKVKKAVEKKKDWSYPGNILPYHVWCRICHYIASPLLDPEARLEDVVLATRHLLTVGYLGKLVYEPAMVALYRCPPIFDQASFQLLSRTLRQPPSHTLITYRPKVETLRIDVGDVLYLKYGGSYLLLDDIVPYLPRLMDLELYHFLDKAPYRSLEATVRYKYPDNLLQVLGPLPDAVAERGDKATPTELLSWRWNARLAGDVYPLNALKKIHSTPSFASLRKIAFVNYQVPSSIGKPAPPQILEERDAAATADLAAAIGALPHLEHLILESSTMADANLLGLLPKNLKHLELINCWEVISDDFAEFLRTHGNSLERLTLKHCISLSMGFTSVLEHTCPNLTHLHINLLYYKTHEHYNDAEPLYDYLLKDHEAPKWPSSIQSIEIDYMRFESVKTAEMLFKSLVASAPKLPNLRRLVLGAKMNVSFRERTEFRKTWEERTRAVFQRRDDPPVPVHDQSAEDSDGQDHELILDSRDRGLKSVREVRVPTRRSTRLGEHLPSPSRDDETEAQKNSTRVLALTRQLRWSMRDIPASKHHDADDEQSEDELAADHHGQIRLNSGKGISRDEDEDVTFIHGLCDVVEIEVDNQKPTEHKYCMDDFLGSPVSDESDAEWNGDESEEEDPVIE